MLEPQPLSWECLAGVSKPWGGLVVCRAWLQTACGLGCPRTPVPACRVPAVGRAFLGLGQKRRVILQIPSSPVSGSRHESPLASFCAAQPRDAPGRRREESVLLWSERRCKASCSDTPGFCSRGLCAPMPKLSVHYLFPYACTLSLDIAPTNRISNKWGVLFQKSSFHKVAY